MPLISVLALNTGICGDTMRYLSMCSATGVQISSNLFLHGTRFFDHLKPLSAQYRDDAACSVRCGGDVLVDQLVHGFASSHSREQTAIDQIIVVLTA